MPFRRGVIDNHDLTIMERAMESACQQLAIDQFDQEARERVAFLVTGFMRAGEHDVDRLTEFVVKQYQLPV